MFIEDVKNQRGPQWSLWAQAQEIITHDKVANLDISMKSIHTKEKIFFLVRFHDPDESILHKPWHWNQSDEIYEIGPEREDGFVFKWAMDKSVSDLSLGADKPYTADVWFWKANRTNPVGYADDKVQRLSRTKMPKSMKVNSKTGASMFLRRQGDKGKPAYQAKLFSVSDSGVGINPEDLDRIFSPFEQAKNTADRSIPGTGLGLSLTKQLINLVFSG